MEALKSWGITICLAALAASIAAIIAPSGKMEKVFKFALSLFFLCCMLVPIFSLKNIKLNLNMTQESSISNNELSSTVSKQATDIAQQNIAQLVASCCRSCGAEPIAVNVKIASKSSSDIMSIESAEVLLKTSDMSKKGMIADAVKKELGITVNIKDGEK